MSGWEVGDLALCLAGGEVTRAGSLYTVRDVLIPDEAREEKGVRYTNTSGYSCLRFVGTVARAGQWATERRFIKVTPPEADEFDRETIDLMLGKPITQGQRNAEYFEKMEAQMRRQMQGDD